MTTLVFPALCLQWTLPPDLPFLGAAVPSLFSSYSSSSWGLALTSFTQEKVGKMELLRLRLFICVIFPHILSHLSLRPEGLSWVHRQALSPFGRVKTRDQADSMTFPGPSKGAAGTRAPGS